MAVSAGDVLQQSGTGFEVSECCSHVVGRILVLRGRVEDRITLMSGTKAGVAVPCWELGGLSLCDVDAGEVMDAVAMGAGHGPLEAIDVVAHLTKEWVLVGGRLARRSCSGGYAGFAAATQSAWCTGRPATANLVAVAGTCAVGSRTATEAVPSVEFPAGAARRDSIADASGIHVPANSAGRSGRACRRSVSGSHVAWWWGSVELGPREER